MVPVNNPPLPLTFRAELLQRLMPQLRAGECCSLVGSSGTGKSNLARFLQRRDVQTSYWGDDHTWVVIIDSHSIGLLEGSPEWEVLELIIHRLIVEAQARGVPTQFVELATDLHSRVVMQPSTHLALRYLERLCALLCHEYQYQLVFLFDEFDDLWRRLDSHFFLNLRNLRDQFKYQVVYLLMTRDQLEKGRMELEATEAFWELFSAHVYGVGVYSEQDALAMLDRLGQRLGVSITDQNKFQLLTLSGRHPALLRALFWIQQSIPDTPLNVPTLLSVPAIAEECRKIWTDMSPEEQNVLTLIANDLPLEATDSNATMELKLKEIISGPPLQVFSPLFAEYIHGTMLKQTAGVVVDTRSRRVWIDGRALADSLSPLEFDLLAYLAENAGAVCKRDDILRAVYREAHVDVSDQRLDTVLRRLRDALGENGRHPKYLVTHRGVGVQLMHASIQD